MEMVVGNKMSFRSCLQPLYVSSLHTRSFTLCPHIYLQAEKQAPFLSTYFYNYYDIIKFDDYTIRGYREWEITSQTLLIVPFAQHWRGVINRYTDLNSLLHAVQTSSGYPAASCRCSDSNLQLSSVLAALQNAHVLHTRKSFDWS